MSLVGTMLAASGARAQAPPRKPDPVSEARDQIARLRSDQFEVRDEASKRLQALDPAALPELEKAAMDPEAEVALRARTAADVIRTRALLSPRLLAFKPGIEVRLALGPEPEWVEAFLAFALEQEEGLVPRYRFEPEELEPLVIRALRGSRRPDETCRVLSAIGIRKIRAAIPAVLDAMGDSDEQIRKSAAETLAHMNVKEAAPSLIRLTDDSSPAVRSTAAWALACLRHTDGLPSIRRLLKDDEPIVRMEAVQSLDMMQDKNAAKEIIPLLMDECPPVRMEAARTLGCLQTQEAIPALLPLLQDDDPDVVKAAISALNYLGAVESAPSIARVLRRAFPDSPLQGVHDVRPDRLEGTGVAVQPVVWLAATTLADLGDTRLIHPLVTDPEPHVRANGVLALGLLYDRDQIPKILPLVKDPDARVRGFAAWALGCAGMRASIPHVRPLLDDEQPDVRTCACVALEALDATEAVPQLMLRLSDKSPDVRAMAARALGTFGTREAAPRMLPLLQDEHFTVRKNSAIALALLGRAEAIPVILSTDLDYRSSPLIPALQSAGIETSSRLLLERLRGRNLSDRIKAAEMLAILGVREASAAIREAALELPVEEHASFAKPLGLLGDPESLPFLRDLAASRYGFSRQQAARALGLMGGPVAVASVTPLLWDEDPNVRASAIQALTRLKANELAPRIAAILDDTNHTDTGHAVRALGVLGIHEQGDALLKRLKDPDLQVDAATALALLGRREGVSVLLESETNLLYLNALRTPSDWDRLHRTMRPLGTFHGRVRTFLERVARELRWTCEWPEGWVGPELTLTASRGIQCSLFHALLAVSSRLEFSPTPLEFVLDKGTLRVLRRRDAVQFWKRWWDEKGKTK